MNHKNSLLHIMDIVIMLKNFLKTSVSAFILLGTLSTLAPSHAMEDGDDYGDKTKITKKNVISNSEGLDGNFSLLPEEVTQHILSLVDPENIPSVALTCKKWLRITLNDEKFRKLFYNKSKNIAQFYWLIRSSPHKFLPLVYAHFEKLANLYPLSLVSHEREIDAEVPNNVITFITLSHDFSKLVIGLRKYHFMFVEKFRALDPLDSQKVALASLILKECPRIQLDLKEKTIENSLFDLNQFPELVKDPKNHSPLQQQLMGLKLLALSEDAEAQTQFQNFSANTLSPLLNSLWEKIIRIKYPEAESKNEKNSESESDEDEIDQELAYLVNQPFWSAFTNDYQAHKEEIDIASTIMQSSFSKSLDPEKYKKFGDYCFTVFPSLLSTSSVVSFYKGIGEIYEAQGNQAEQRNNLKKLYSIMDKKNLRNILEIAELYTDLDEYGKALRILDEASKEVGEEPIRFCFQENQVECILNLQLKNRFSEAKNYIDALLKQFPKDKKELSIYYPTLYDEEEELEGVTYMKEIQNIYDLKGTLHIFEGQLEEAYQCVLKGAKFNDDLPIQALKTQLDNPDLKKAKKLVKLLGIKTEKTGLPFLLKAIKKARSQEISQCHKFIKENIKVFNFLLKNRPAGRKKFRKLITHLMCLNSKNLNNTSYDLSWQE